MQRWIDIFVWREGKYDENGTWYKYICIHALHEEQTLSQLTLELENNYNCQISICFQTIHWCGKWVKRIKTSRIAQWRLSKCKASMILRELQQIHRKCHQLWFCQARHHAELASNNICNENMLFFSKHLGYVFVFLSLFHVTCYLQIQSLISIR